MSVEQHGPYRMTQPEQWMSDHHVAEFVFVATLVTLLVTMVYAAWVAM